MSPTKLFDRNDFDVALASRSKDRLDGRAAPLARTGITAGGFPAYIANTVGLVGALEAAIARFGRIDVLEFSPHSGLTRPRPRT